MTTYNTYQEAKIANPECNVWHLNGMLFASKNQTVVAGLWKECNPADHCMTVEKFLADGYKFVEGDKFLNAAINPVELITVGGRNVTEEVANTPSSTVDGICYILRAAALEDKQESQHDMQESQGNSHQQLMETLNDACGIFGCIPSYLIKNIEGLMATNKEYAKALSGNASLEEKPRAKVEYVKVNGNYNGGAFWECAKDYSEGVIFTTMGSSEQLVVDSIDELLDRYKWNNLYRRIETPMTEREAFVDGLSDWAEDSGLNVSAEVWDSLFDSGLVKLVN